ncbi:MAG TPA: endonuclease/exonuclease/phosphatase family protein [Methylomirabilota bacterium]|jgi:endonuclease/exonuclease/phosphatase family metal-dependent hydrolase|nr:endonuclease/exonuclease/phosphatase family protein [Methylomirabilota bacterium]
MTAWRLRILSANLANGRADADAFGELVEAAGPDVVAVQELAPPQAEALARVLPFGKLEPAWDHHGMGIALREPGSVRALPLPYRSAFVAELPGPADDESIEILNLHLAAPHVHPVVQRMKDRRGQLRHVLAHLDATPRRRRALAGDLNSTPLWPAYRRLRARFDDAAVEAARRIGRRPGRTWGPWAGSMRLLRIDHVLVRGLAAAETSVLPLRGSDHSALVADLELLPG